MAVVSSVGIVIRLLGRFQILKMGTPVSLRSGGKVEQLISCLALQPIAEFTAKPWSNGFGPTPLPRWRANLSIPSFMGLKHNLLTRSMDNLPSCMSEATIR